MGHHETALDMARKLGKSDVVQFLEKKIEEASVTRPLQVFAAMDSAVIAVTCANLGGDELAAFTLDPDAKLLTLLELVYERLPLAVGAWTIILPTGETLDETQVDIDVKFLFGLSI